MIEVNGAWIEFLSDRAIIQTWEPVECIKCHRMTCLFVNRGETLCVDCEGTNGKEAG